MTAKNNKGWPGKQQKWEKSMSEQVKNFKNTTNSTLIFTTIFFKWCWGLKYHNIVSKLKTIQKDWNLRAIWAFKERVRLKLTKNK